MIRICEASARRREAGSRRRGGGVVTVSPARAAICYNRHVRRMAAPAGSRSRRERVGCGLLAFGNLAGCAGKRNQAVL